MFADKFDPIRNCNAAGNSIAFMLAGCWEYEHFCSQEWEEYHPAIREYPDEMDLSLEDLELPF